MNIEALRERFSEKRERQKPTYEELSLELALTQRLIFEEGWMDGLSLACAILQMKEEQEMQ